MGVIRQLPEEIVNKIAAGEVVERPASIVKELIENSFDAGANTIEVFVKEGGKDLIQVKDNGMGISKDDLELAVMPHTTSKVSSIEDLSKLSTYGFRGEALASISGVSRLTLHSRHKDADIGYEYAVFEGRVTPKPRSIGTTVTVQDLFYNVPARRKFLKSASTEFKHILDTVLALALARPEVSFVLLKDQTTNEVLNLRGNVQRKDRALDILGVQSEHVFEVQYESFGISIYAILLKPQYIRSIKRRLLKILVNNRVVEDKGIYRAVKEAARPVFALDISAVGVLYIDLPATWVDFNVHPRKIEVRFSNPYRVYDTVERGLKTVLVGEQSNTEETSITLPKPSYQTEVFKTNLKVSPDSIQNTGGYSDSSYRGDPVQADLGGVSDLGITLPLVSEGKQTPIATIGGDAEGVWPGDPIKVVQLLNRYILAEYPDRVLLIDQHAAAERVRFEELGGEGDIEDTAQTLLAPFNIDLEGTEVAIQEVITDLELLGFKLSIEGTRLIVKAIPSYFSEVQAKELLFGITEKLLEMGENHILSVEQLIPAEFSELKRLLIATKACHTSIRANTPLKEEQMLQLVRQLFSCKVPFVCPHGRPVFVEFTPRELDRFFWRDIK